MLSEKKKSIKTLYENLKPKIPDVLLPLEKEFWSTIQILPFTTHTLQWYVFYEHRVFSRINELAKFILRLLKYMGYFGPYKTYLKYSQEHSPKPHTLHTPVLADYTGLFAFTRSRSYYKLSQLTLRDKVQPWTPFWEKIITLHFCYWNSSLIHHQRKKKRGSLFPSPAQNKLPREGKSFCITWTLFHKYNRWHKMTLQIYFPPLMPLFL